MGLQGPKGQCSAHSQCPLLLRGSWHLSSLEILLRGKEACFPNSFTHSFVDSHALSSNIDRALQGPLTVTSDVQVHGSLTTWEETTGSGTPALELSRPRLGPTSVRMGCTHSAPLLSASHATTKLSQSRPVVLGAAPRTPASPLAWELSGMDACLTYRWVFP